MVPFRTPYGLLFPKIGGSETQPKNSIAIISGTGRATDFIFGTTFYSQGPSEQSPLRIWEKRERGRIQ